jgi:hypothetical protein
MCENAERKKQKKDWLCKLIPIIYIKGSFYETPLYGHVQRDKQDCDKGRGMRSTQSP